MPKRTNLPHKSKHGKRRYRGKHFTPPTKIFKADIVVVVVGMEECMEEAALGCTTAAGWGEEGEVDTDRTEKRKFNSCCSSEMT